MLFQFKLNNVSEMTWGGGSQWVTMLNINKYTRGKKQQQKKN